jgi:hypothetical protein
MPHIEINNTEQVPFLFINDNKDGYYVSTYITNSAHITYDSSTSLNQTYHPNRENAMLEMLRWSIDKNLSYNDGDIMNIRGKDFDLLHTNAYESWRTLANEDGDDDSYDNDTNFENYLDEAVTELYGRFRVIRNSYRHTS